MILDNSFIELGSRDIENLMETFTKEQDQNITFIILTEIINKIHPYINGFPSTLSDKFDTTVCKSIGETWKRASFYLDKEYCLKIVGALVPKRNNKNGDLMKILDFVFGQIQEIIELKLDTNDAKVALYEFAIITADHGQMLKLFLLVERILFKYTIFDRFIEPKRANQWLFFSNIIRKFMSKDKRLEAQIDKIPLI